MIASWFALRALGVVVRMCPLDPGVSVLVDRVRRDYNYVATVCAVIEYMLGGALLLSGNCVNMRLAGGLRLY